MNSVFSEEILADKLSKLNSTQQCIETLSHWCIFHRSKAELVVKTWDKQFHSSQLAQKVPLLYLSNDILQNSKRKGDEFVNEFWKVLPAALKDVVEKGDDHGKNVVSRLVNIWKERRVFGSREKSLQEVMLGEELPPPLELNKKRQRAVRIIKRDSRSIRTKLSIGSVAEKIVSAYHLVLGEHSTENEEMNKCKSAVNRVKKMEKDVDIACTNAKDSNRKNLVKELEEEENLLQQCIEKLKLVEANRIALVSQLKEALLEQEAELENVRTQMQVAQAQVVESNNMRKQLDDENCVVVSRPKRTAASLAAEVADKLTASSSSQSIMSSVLSTFAAEAAKSAGLTNSSPSLNTSNSMPFNPITNSMSKPDSNHLVMAQPNPHYQYHLVPNPNLHPNPSPIPNPIPNPNPPSEQPYMQYSYGSIPTPAPQQNHLVGPVVSTLNQQPLQMGQQPQQPMSLAQSHSLHLLTQQPPAPPSFRPVQPPAMVCFGHPHHSQ